MPNTHFPISRMSGFREEREEACHNCYVTRPTLVGVNFTVCSTYKAVSAGGIFVSSASSLETVCRCTGRFVCAERPVKRNVRLSTASWKRLRELEVQLRAFKISVLDRGEWSPLRPGRCIAGRELHPLGRTWVGSRPDNLIGCVRGKLVSEWPC